VRCFWLREGDATGADMQFMSLFKPKIVVIDILLIFYHAVKLI